MRESVEVGLADADGTLCLQLLYRGRLQRRVETLQEMACRGGRSAERQEIVLGNERNTRQAAGDFPGVYLCRTLECSLLAEREQRMKFFVFFCRFDRPADVLDSRMTGIIGNFRHLQYFRYFYLVVFLLGRTRKQSFAVDRRCLHDVVAPTPPAGGLEIRHLIRRLHAAGIEFAELLHVAQDIAEIGLQ